MERLIDPVDGPRVIKIVNNDIIKQLQSSVLSFWPDRKNNYFPAPLPVSLERKNFYKLKQFPYLICVKSDGTRYLMLVYRGATYFVDRAFNFYKIIEDDVINHANNVRSGGDQINLMVDGELLKNKNSEWTYIIHDCIVVDSKDISKSNFDIRYEAVKDIIESRQGFTSDFKLATKKFYSFSEIDILISELSNNKINHITDGLIFTPLTLGIGTQTQYTLFKWKERSHHTFDFKITESPSEFIAYVNQGPIDKKYASVDKRTKEGIEFSRLLKLRCPTFKSGMIVELDYKDACFEPRNLRLDKLHPNSLYTIEKTIKNITENITLDEIIELINS